MQKKIQRKGRKELPYKSGCGELGVRVLSGNNLSVYLDNRKLPFAL